MSVQHISIIEVCDEKFMEHVADIDKQIFQIQETLRGIEKQLYHANRLKAAELLRFTTNTNLEYQEHIEEILTEAEKDAK